MARGKRAEAQLCNKAAEKLQRVQAVASYTQTAENSKDKCGHDLPKVHSGLLCQKENNEGHCEKQDRWELHVLCKSEVETRVRSHPGDQT